MFPAIQKTSLKRPPTVISDLAVEEEICPEYKCVSTKPPPEYIYNKDECPKIVCQPNYIPVLDDIFYSKKSKGCPSYSCYPPPEPDVVCNVTGKTFNTFDNTEYKYDICNNVLARDLEADEWDVSCKSERFHLDYAKNCIIKHIYFFSKEIVYAFMFSRLDYPP